MNRLLAPSRNGIQVVGRIALILFVAACAGCATTALKLPLDDAVTRIPPLESGKARIVYFSLPPETGLANLLNLGPERRNIYHGDRFAYVDTEPGPFEVSIFRGILGNLERETVTAIRDETRFVYLGTGGSVGNFVEVDAHHALDLIDHFDLDYAGPELPPPLSGEIDFLSHRSGTRSTGSWFPTDLPPIPDGMGRLLLYQPESRWTDHLAVVNWKVLVDGELRGSLKFGQYIYVDLPSGRHTLDNQHILSPYVWSCGPSIQVDQGSVTYARMVPLGGVDPISAPDFKVKIFWSFAALVVDEDVAREELQDMEFDTASMK